ncbi:MAG: hypothetical protein AAFX06_19265 [Planctomycetota bacterium]
MFRILSLVALTLVTSPAAFSQEFSTPFEPLSAIGSGSKLVLMLVTDEDAFAAGSDVEAESRELWCERSLLTSVASLLEQRPELKERLELQKFAAGTPAILTGGHARPWPRRVVIVITDGSYRLLSFVVGVPQTRELTKLIEDAEETLAILRLNDSNPKLLAEALADRTEERVDRAYVAVMRQEMAEYVWGDTLTDADETWRRKFMGVAHEFDPVYRFDAKLRFELEDSGDAIRLRALEQHLEPRRGWCDTISPFIVGRPANQALPTIIDSVWNETPVLPKSVTDHEELLSWYKTQRDNSMVVLAIRPPLMARQKSWPPPTEQKGKLAGRGWSALEKAMSAHPFRTVDASELATLMSNHGEQVFDFLLPSRARYVFFEPGKERTFVIREGDLPAKFLRRF